MILYVDETECDEYFFVTGLLAFSPKVVNEAYKHFKKKARKIPMQENSRAKLFTEFKSTILDKDYRKIKTVMLQELSKIDCAAIYSCYVKKCEFKQSVKEKVYTALLMRIVAAIENNVEIVFDTFNNPDFEKDIVNAITGLPNVISIKPCDSQKAEGIQFADNLCSVMRLHRTGKDTNGFYSVIEQFVKEV